MTYYRDKVFERIDNPHDPNDVIPVLVTVAACEAEHGNRWQQQLFAAIHELEEEVRNVLVVCFGEDDLPWPLPLHPVMYYFEPGNHTPLLFTYRGVDTDHLSRDLARARRMMHEGLSYEEALYEPEELERIRETEAQMDADIDNPKYPSAFKMVRSLGREAWKAAKAKGQGLPVIASADKAAERFETCQACPHFTGDGRCTKCGCFMKTKVNLETAECPIGKW